MNEIKWHNRARKQIKKVPANYREKIFDSVDKLTAFPETHGLNIKKLTNHQYDFRLRVGRYRVLFDHADGIKVVAIQEVRKRDDRTY